ncbi:LytR/AlgR family response regulator transcription factor [Taibaiella koreensis]|uniref:LytR/AlgR family response regulator transcription factor n=1 Tax=Taibaiella koreensis TaxID=1268548 RepID=UPI000E59B748|nr:LytTR family DNA-binding domain-containing protein [Taibaiella koreensis]
MNMYRAIIVDDELMGIKTLKLLLEKNCPDVKVVATAIEPQAGITFIDDYRPDIVFLDISMPQMSGFELLEQTYYKDFCLVFTTAHAEHAIKAIRNKAHDYLLKPIDAEELKACVHNIRNRPASKRETGPGSSRQVIELPVKDGIIFIRPADIVRVEASGSYTIFHLDKGVRHLVSGSMKTYESYLDPATFFRCHLSHIVHLDKVVKLHSADGLFAKMCDGSMVEVARRNKQAFLEKLKNG